VKLSLGPIALAALLVGCTAGPAEDDEASSDNALGGTDFDRYAQIARDNGVEVDGSTAVVIGLRNGGNYVKAFDESFVVLSTDGTATTFHASTHPFQNSAPGVPDVDHDGKADVGEIKPGVYDATPRGQLVAGQPSWNVSFQGDGHVPGWRDTNHDGVLDDDERAASEKRKDTLTDVLFHQGDNGSPPVVGCQVLPSTAIKDFTKAVGGARARFRYVLVVSQEE
jgi:hypothetical protein